MGNAGSMVTHLAKQQQKLIDIPSRCLITQQILQMSRANIRKKKRYKPRHLRYNEMHSPDTKIHRYKVLDARLNAVFYSDQ